MAEPKRAKYRSSLWKLRLAQVILALCILLSLGGIFYAVKVTKCDGDGGRGGAIADALALSVMFLNRDNASTLFNVISLLNPEDKSDPRQVINSTTVHKIVKEDITLLLELLEADARNQNWQNFYLALATFVGTLIWGFGDMISRSFIGHRC